MPVQFVGQYQLSANAEVYDVVQYLLSVKGATIASRATLIIPAESRTMLVKAENRTMLVKDEPRTLKVG